MTAMPQQAQSQKAEGDNAADVKTDIATDILHTEASGEDRGRAAKAPSAFRTISEVADDLAVQQHVLRFWETKFSQIKPLKRGGGRRYYRPEDVLLLKKIHHLLYTEGYTIKGVQKLLKGQGRNQIVNSELAADAAPKKPAPAATVSSTETFRSQAGAVKQEPARAGLTDKQRSILNAMLGDLKELRDMMRGEGE